jgi:hypothetical protein
MLNQTCSMKCAEDKDDDGKCAGDKDDDGI